MRTRQLGHTRSTRRSWLYSLGASLGSVAFSDLLAKEDAGPLAPKTPHHQAKAKACIFLVMEGGPSHIDTFDPKPKLEDLHMQKFQRVGEQFSPMSSGERYYVQSPYQFRKVGQAGMDMCEHFTHLPEVADELCIYRGCQSESVDHPTALFHMNTGNKFGGDPAVGSWVTYGLGSDNQNLPGYIVLTEAGFPQGGAGNWTNGFLPAYFQGTPLRAEGSPILDIHPPAWKTREHQRANLDILAGLNRSHQARHPRHDELAAPDVELRARVPYANGSPGHHRPKRRARGRCEQHTGWTTRKRHRSGVAACWLVAWSRRACGSCRSSRAGGTHTTISNASHKARIYSIDKPVTALVKDLRQRGLLDETLVVWLGEFGRSPDNHHRGGGIAIGRDHNAEAQSMFFAGGGIRAGHVVGATDEIGHRAVEIVHPIKDLHVTLLHLLGLNDSKLTYFHGGRFKQLSQTGGQVIKELVDA